MTEHQIKTPKRRFKGFTGEWESMRLDNFCVVNPKTCEIPDQFYYIDLESVEKGILIESKIIDKKKSPSRAQRLLSIGDILFQTVRPYQQNNYLFKIDNRLPTVASTGYAQIRTNEDNRFLYYLLHTNKFNKDVMIRCTGSNYPAINSTDLLEIDITVPNIQEQQKIGEFFSELDERIELEKSKVEKMKALKKAYLYEMFPAEGETTPKRRFKGFTGEWEEVKLGEVIDAYSGGTPTVGKPEYYGGNIPFIRSAEINSDSTELFITELGLNNSSAKMVEIGYILYALYGATSGEVGISKIKGAINQAILAIIPKSDYDTQFITQWLRREKYKIIDKYLQGGQGNLSGTIVKNLEIMFPSLEEQIKIGEFFSELDEVIELHEEKVKKLQDLKEAYLNELLI